MIPFLRRAVLTALAPCVLLAQQPPAPRDAVTDAQRPASVAATRPEQQKNNHDRSAAFAGTNAPAASPVLKTQPKEEK